MQLSAAQPNERPLPDRFFAQSPDLMCIVGYDGYFKRVNPAWTQLLGWTEAELVDQPALNIVHPDDHERLKAARSAVRAGSHPKRIEIRYVHKDGSFRWIWWNVFPQPEEKIIYAIGRDITAQKKLASSKSLRTSRAVTATSKSSFMDEKKYGLTRTESKVATLIMRGCTAKEAAEELGVSYNTVKVHLRHVFEKVGVRNQRALISAMFSNQPPYH